MLLFSGVMKNTGICEKLREEFMPKKVNLPDEPQIAGALGACQTYRHSRPNRFDGQAGGRQ
jgi:activator of 2-hydroxyglutaryl-CoA dehydratase